jgi:hypothetical protein
VNNELSAHGYGVARAVRPYNIAKETLSNEIAGGKLKLSGREKIAMQVWHFFLRCLALAIMTAMLPGGVFSQTGTKWLPLFNGTSLEGWGYNSDYWRVEDGIIHGEGKSPTNTFAHFKSLKYTDFVLSIKTRLWQTAAGYTNSGVQYRSEFVDSSTHRMKGYQSEIGDDLDGSMYPEANFPTGANMIYANDACKKAIKQNAWNHVLVTANGATVKHELNGNKCLEFTATVMDGYIGLQMHSSDLVSKVEFRDIFIRPLNNSFTIPEGLGVTLDETFASAVIEISPKTVFDKFKLNGNELIISSSLWGNSGRFLEIGLLNMQGRKEYSRLVATSSTAPLQIVLPELGHGDHILFVETAGQTHSEIVRLSR